MATNKIVLSILISSALTGCGGGSSGKSKDPVPAPVPANAGNTPGNTGKAPGGETEGEADTELSFTLTPKTFSLAAGESRNIEASWKAPVAYQCQISVANPPETIKDLQNQGKTSISIQENTDITLSCAKNGSVLKNTQKVNVQRGSAPAPGTTLSIKYERCTQQPVSPVEDKHWECKFYLNGTGKLQIQTDINTCDMSFKVAGNGISGSIDLNHEGGITGSPFFMKLLQDSFRGCEVSFEVKDKTSGKVLLNTEKFTL